METFESLMPFLIVPSFIAVWCGVCLLLAKVGGWSNLAARFRVASIPSGEKFSFIAAKVGGIRYKGVLTAIKAEQGLYLSVFAPWRLGHPAILIPWSELKNPRPTKVFGTDWIDVSVFTPGVVIVRLPEKLLQGRIADA